MRAPSVLAVQMGIAICSCYAYAAADGELTSCVRLYAPAAAVGVFQSPKSVPAHCMHTCLYAEAARLNL